MDGMTQDFTRLTVPQLKTLCKERKIKGYSKLGRPALLQLLCDTLVSQPNQIAVLSNDLAPVNRTTHRVSHQTDNESKKIGTTSATLSQTGPRSVKSSAGNSNPASILAVNMCGSQPCPGNIPAHEDLCSRRAPHTDPDRELEAQLSGKRIQSSHGLSPPSAVPGLGAILLGSSHILATAVESPARSPKRSVPPGIAHSHKNLKKLKASLDVEARTGFSRLADPAVPLVSASPSDLTSSFCPVHNDRVGPLSTSRSIPNTISSSALLPVPKTAGVKRFKPLLPTKPLGISSSRISVNDATPKKISSGSSRLKSSVNTPIKLRYLDFYFSSSVPALQIISLPPSLAQRRRVQCWAIILAGISNEDRRRCVLVSRMFRYAVYLSAFHILEQRYAGRRFAQIKQQYSAAMTNMWPYLRLRDAEASDGLAVFLGSCLAKLDKKCGTRTIATRLWGGPDHKRQVSVAMRFILSRYWFVLSIGGRPEDLSSWLEEIVVDAQEVIPNEIWSITVEQPGFSATHTFHILDSTCEVIGLATRALCTEDSTLHKRIAPRADWSAYIHNAISNHSPSQAPPGTLLDQLKWDGYEEFDKGISRLWLQNLSDSEEDRMKRTVATRYILACVVGNSVSGSWKSTSEMAQEFAGLSAKMDTMNTKAQHTALNLYLPSHHHVESVHFRTSSGEALHSALAAVQTLHREYFVLKDIGMEVGNEENGVYGVWMEVLNCSNKGIPLI